MEQPPPAFLDWSIARVVPSDPILLTRLLREAVMMSFNYEELDSLQRTFNDAMNVFRQELQAAELPPLSLQATERHPLDEYSYLAPPRLYEARRLALATMGQIKSLIQFPFERVYEEVLSVYNRSTIDTMVTTGVADFLGSVTNSQRGAHVSEIGKALDMSSRKLTIVLRYLAAGGWVHEIDEGTFALTRLGLELLHGAYGRKLLTFETVSAIAAKLPTWLQHPEWKYSDAVNHTPVQMVYNTELSLFQWLKEHPGSLVRMAEGIRATGDAYIHAVLTDYPWNTLEGRTLVDCGGGLGFLSIQLAKTYPSLHFVVQDLPETVAMAQANIVQEFAQEQDRQRIVAEAQDFFQPQSRRGGEYNYLFRYVLHDWADHEATKILQNIAAAAGPRSKIIIIETISTPGTIADKTSKDAKSELNALGNATYQQISAPPFIPANFGAAAKGQEALRLHLLSLMNAQGRTLNNWQAVISAAGLEIRRIVPLRADASIIECGLPSNVYTG